MVILNVHRDNVNDVNANTASLAIRIITIDNYGNDNDNNSEIHVVTTLWRRRYTWFYIEHFHKNYENDLKITSYIV